MFPLLRKELDHDASFDGWICHNLSMFRNSSFLNKNTFSLSDKRYIRDIPLLITTFSTFVVKYHNYLVTKGNLLFNLFTFPSNAQCALVPTMNQTHKYNLLHKCLHNKNEYYCLKNKGGRNTERWPDLLQDIESVNLWSWNLSQADSLGYLAIFHKDSDFFLYFFLQRKINDKCSVMYLKNINK